MRVADGNFEDIIHFITTGTALEGYTVQQKKELVVCVSDFSIIDGILYKMGTDEILRWYVPKFERSSILMDTHGCCGKTLCRGRDCAEDSTRRVVVANPPS